MAKDKKKKNDKEESAVKKAPGKGKKFSFFGKKKINSTDDFQINISQDDNNVDSQQDFDYGGYEEQNFTQENSPNYVDSNNVYNNENISPAGASGYIPNANNNNYPYYDANKALANNSSNMANNTQTDENIYDNLDSKNDEDIYLPEDDSVSHSDDEKVKALTEAYKRAKRPQNCLVVTIMIVIAIVCLMFRGIILIIGAVICFLSVFGAIFKYQDRVKYSKPIMYLALLVALGYVFTLVFVNDIFHSNISETMSIAFKNKAEQFIDYVRQTEIGENKKLKCIIRGVKKENFAIYSTNSAAYESPFGGEFDKDNSYVLVEAEYIDKQCVYTYSIFLTDGVYQLGEPYNPVREDMFETTKLTRR